MTPVHATLDGQHTPPPETYRPEPDLPYYRETEVKAVVDIVYTGMHSNPELLDSAITVQIQGMSTLNWAHPGSILTKQISLHDTPLTPDKGHIGPNNLIRLHTHSKMRNPVVGTYELNAAQSKVRLDE